VARACERNNLANGVCGILLYSDNVYLQLLEGDSVTLDQLWAKISIDRRHGVEWIVRGEGRHDLTGLPMGYFDAVREHSAEKRTAIWRERAHWSPEMADALRLMLVSLAREKYPTSLGPTSLGPTSLGQC
jgi:hypothetical protein